MKWTWIATTRIRLAEIESIRLRPWGTMVFELRGGGRDTLWLRRAFTDAGRRWLLERLSEPVAQARTKEATREPADRSSRRRRAMLYRKAAIER